MKKLLLLITLSSFILCTEPPKTTRIYNAPSLKFLSARKVAENAPADDFGQLLDAGDARYMQLPSELKNYIQFMIRHQGTENSKLSGIDCKEMLDAACASGNLDETLLKDLLAIDSNLNIEGTNRTLTPLMWAAMMGKPSIMNLLIEKGADVCHQLSSGNTPALAIAHAPEIRESHVIALELLQEKHAFMDKPNENNQTPLLRLCHHGWDEKQATPIQIKLIELLLKGGANINYQGNYNQSAVMIAASHDPVLLTTLLKYNPNLELTDDNGKTALIYAAEDDNFETLKLLKNAGANIDHRPNTYINSALTSATHQQKTERLANLLKLGANTEVTDCEENTALIIAARKNDLDVSSLLLQYGANVNTTNRHSDTPLLITLWKENFSLARLLLNSTKQITAPDHISSFIPALNKLLKSEHTDILKGMLDKGLFNIIEKSPSYWRHMIINDATADMKKLLLNYRSIEYKQSAWYKRLIFETKRFRQDHNGAVVLGSAAIVTAAVGTGLWYLMKNKDNSALPTLASTIQAHSNSSNILLALASKNK